MLNLRNMGLRLNYEGGIHTHDRIVKDKLKSLKSAIGNSYQSEIITFNNQEIRCLINPEKLTTDYDQKVISIEFEYNMSPGDTFYWNRTDSYWIVYTVFEEEEAYFRARIRQCDYQIEVNNNPYWIWLRGPVETSLVWRQKHKIEFNDLNHTLFFYIKDNEETREFFSRHRIVKFDNHNWRVAATDKYSQKGVIEVYLEEYFDNEMEDQMIVPEIIEHKEDDPTPYIEGPQDIYVYDTDVEYKIINNASGEFYTDSEKVKITETTLNSCKIDVLTSKTANFTLYYGFHTNSDLALPIRINSF